MSGRNLVGLLSVQMSYYVHLGPMASETGVSEQSNYIHHIPVITSPLV